MSGRSMVKLMEGRRSIAYRDTLGFWTIGIGHKGPDVFEHLVWSDAKIDAAFEVDYSNAERSVLARLPWAAGLNDARLAVLVSMTFQMGLAGVLKFAKALAAMSTGAWQKAHDEMLDSLWAKQTPKRAKHHADQMLTGEWQEWR